MPEYDEVDEQEQDEAAAARPFWSGTISFGLVSVPVNLFPANRSSRVSLRMLGPKGRPLSRRYYSEETGRDLAPEQIVRGYETEKGKYVVVTDEELERLAPGRSRDIDLRRFVDEKDLPRAYFERGYFLTPSGGSVKAYRLLAETMEQTGRAGIATFVMRGKEYLVAILSDNGILRAETLRFSDELRSPDDIGLPKKKKPDSKQVTSFAKLIEKQSIDELPRKEMQNRDAERLLKLVDGKKAKHEDVVGKRQAGKAEPKVVDLLEVLQRTLAQAKDTPARKTTAKKKAPARRSA